MENFTKKQEFNSSIKNFIFFRSVEVETDILVTKDSIKTTSLCLIFNCVKFIVEFRHSF